MHYRLAFVAGSTYFFMVSLLKRDKLLLTDHIVLLKRTFRRIKSTRPFDIDAIVVLPNHCMLSGQSQQMTLTSRLDGD